LINDSKIEPLLAAQIVFCKRIACFLEAPETHKMNRPGVDIGSPLFFAPLAGPLFPGPKLFLASLLFLRIADIKAEERLNVFDQFFSGYSSKSACLAMAAGVSKTCSATASNMSGASLLKISFHSGA
jgi:hypothetical protein